MASSIQELLQSSTVPVALDRIETASRAERTGRTHPRGSYWTADEHERFLLGVELFPHGPWKEVAAVVGSKTTRQTMTHAQKYRQKLERRRRRRLTASVENMVCAANAPLSPIADVSLDTAGEPDSLASMLLELFGEEQTINVFFQGVDGFVADTPSVDLCL